MTDEKSTDTFTESSLLLNGIVVFNPINNELSTNKASIKLAYTESKMLSLLVASENNIVSRERIISFSWEGRVVTDASLAKSISNLRKALRNLGLEDECIITIPRIGYRSTLSAQIIFNPTSVDLDSIYSSEDEIHEPCQHNKLGHADISDSSRRIIPEISSETSDRFHFFKKIIQTTGYLASVMLVFMSTHNFFWDVDRDVNKNHIATGYEEINSSVDGKTYRIIKEDKKALSEDMKAIISLSPVNSTVFIQERDGIYNVCFFINKIPSSFTFKNSNIDKAKCQIRQFLSKESTICEL